MTPPISDMARNTRSMDALCVDVGGSRVKSSLWSDGVRQGELVVHPAPSGATALIDLLAGLWQMHTPTQWALALPGTVAGTDHWSMSAAYGVGHGGVDLAAAFAAHDVPAPDALCNDGFAATWGEFLMLGGGERDRVVVLNMGSGMGGGVVLDGQVHSGLAQEIGHISPGEGALCRCGRRGCAELHLGWIPLSAASGYGQPSELRAAYDDGDQRAVSLVNRADRSIAMIGAYCGALLMPRHLVVTGGTAQALYGGGGIDRLVPLIADAMLADARHPMQLHLGVGDEAVARGLFALLG